MLTIAYLTNRKEPHIEWFFRSLRRECKGHCADTKVIVVDFWCNHRPAGFVNEGVIHVPPKPTVWQGHHKLTKDNWFAASNARNTALCLAPDGWIAHVDDLSVLMPGWLSCVREAMNNNYIACGSYRKVNKLIVEEDGSVPNWAPVVGQDKAGKTIEIGLDTRFPQVKQDLTPHTGGWLYGCSLAAPVEALLSINGWPEDLCDGMGYEDVYTGIVLHNAGFRLMYDRRMMTLESEEGHRPTRDDATFIRRDPGVSPNDKSHAALAVAQSSTRFENVSVGNIRDLRARLLRGDPFPPRTEPAYEWFSKQHLSLLQ